MEGTSLPAWQWRAVSPSRDSVVSCFCSFAHSTEQQHQQQRQQEQQSDMSADDAMPA